MSSAPGRRGTHWALVAMILGAIVMVYPYVFMIGSSLKTRKEFAEARSSLIPPRYQPAEVLAHLRGEDSARDWPGADWPVYQNYVDAVRYGQVDRYLANSFIYAVLITAAQLFFNVLAAYAFARMHFAGRDFLFTLLLSTMMVPPAVLLVPNFMVVRDLGLVDTLWGILLNVILPLSKPALITLGLFTFMGSWNMFEWPLVVLSNQDYYPLTVGLSFFRAETSSDWPRIFAASAMGAAPLIALFLLAQRYLVGGISLSGMKT